MNITMESRGNLKPLPAGILSSLLPLPFTPSNIECRLNAVLQEINNWIIALPFTQQDVGRSTYKKLKIRPIELFIF